MFFFIGFFGIIFAPFIIFFGMIYSYLRLVTTYIELQDEGIQVRAGIIVKSRSLFLYSKIQDVQVFQGLTDRILGLQSISIKTMTIGSAVGGIVPGLKTADAEHIKEFVLRKLNKNFVSGATSNNASFDQSVAAQETIDTMRLNPWPMHFFKPFVLSLLGLVPVSIVLLAIGLIYLPVLFVAFLLIPISLFGAGVGFIKVFIQSIAFKYYVGKTRIEIERKFISMNRNTLPIFKIQDVVIFRKFWNRIVGLSDINIETGELQIVSTKGSGQDEQYIGNYIPLLASNDALELRKYIYDALRLDIEEAEPSLVKEHPLEARKVIKKTISGTILAVFIVGLLSLFIVVPIAIGFVVNSPNLFGIPTLLILAGAMVAMVIFLVIWQFIYQYFYLKYYYYNISKDAIVVRKGVLSTSEIVLPFRKIQNVFVDQDILDKIFGLYDVHYSTVTTMSANLCHIDGLNKQNAEAIREILMTMTTSK
ncbi:MAG: PH domain-containing protein [archaeon]